MFISFQTDFITYLAMSGAKEIYSPVYGRFILEEQFRFM